MHRNVISEKKSRGVESVQSVFAGVRELRNLTNEKHFEIRDSLILCDPNLHSGGFVSDSFQDDLKARLV